jgi:hypothetical protein
MFYHLRLSVWGAQMLELIGETHIDLRSLVQKGQVPDLEEWHKLRCDGRPTGVIRLSIKYLDSQADEQPRNAGNQSVEPQMGKDNLQGMDVRVW